MTVLGAIYAVAAVAAFVAFIVDVWAAAGMVDRALLIGLVAAAACGIWLLVTGLENLGVHLRTHRSSGSH